MALFGVVHAFLGVVFGFPDMRARLHVDLASEGNMFLLLFLGVATIYLSGGLLVDRFGSKPVLAGVLAIYAAAMFAFSQATSVHLAMPATYFIGMGGGGLSICSSVLITEIYQEQRVAMMVAINAAMALGSLTFTFGAAALAGRLGVPFLALVVAAVIVLQGCFCLTQKFPSSLAAHGFSLANAVRVLAYPGVYLYALLLFVEATNEIAVVGWTPTWMGEIGASPRLATAALGMLQTALLVGRLVSFPFLKRIPMTMMVVCSLGAFLGAVIMFLSHTVPFMLVGVVILGFTYAAIYPSLLGFARDRYHQFAGTLMGAMMTSGVTGSMFGPWIVGHLPRAVPLHTRLIVPVVGTFLFIFLILALRRRTLRERAAAATVPEPETYGVS
jgi:MFS family permease